MKVRAEADLRDASDAWWKEVLAGEVTARHPLYGDELKVKLTDGRLVMWGEVPTKRDRDQLVREARARVGNGLHVYDASRVKIRPTREKPGLLVQTLVAAYAHRDTAQLALDFLLEHLSDKPLRAELLDMHAKTDVELPPEVAEEAKRQIVRGETLVVVEVDETEAFRVRALLEEDTRSAWTVAAPPRLMRSRKK